VLIPGPTRCVIGREENKINERWNTALHFLSNFSPFLEEVFSAPIISGGPDRKYSSTLIPVFPGVYYHELIWLVGASNFLILVELQKEKMHPRSRQNHQSIQIMKSFKLVLAIFFLWVNASAQPVAEKKVIITGARLLTHYLKMDW
jgi:hypothetical protein